MICNHSNNNIRSLSTHYHSVSPSSEQVPYSACGVLRTTWRGRYHHHHCLTPQSFHDLPTVTRLAGREQNRDANPGRVHVLNHLVVQWPRPLEASIFRNRKGGLVPHVSCAETQGKWGAMLER